MALSDVFEGMLKAGRGDLVGAAKTGLGAAAGGIWAQAKKLFDPNDPRGSILRAAANNVGKAVLYHMFELWKMIRKNPAAKVSIEDQIPEYNSIMSDWAEKLGRPKRI